MSKSGLKIYNLILLIALPILVVALVLGVTLAAITDYKSGASSTITVGDIGNVTGTITLNSGQIYPGSTTQVTVNLQNAAGNIPITISGLSLSSVMGMYPSGGDAGVELKDAVTLLSGSGTGWIYDAATQTFSNSTALSGGATSSNLVLNLKWTEGKDSGQEFNPQAERGKYLLDYYSGIKFTFTFNALQAA